MKLVRIPRHLLHIDLDGLAELGVPQPAAEALRALLADLPLVPDASHSAALVGPESVTLPCLAVLARHVGQGLRDFNLSLAADKARLHLERQKLVFLPADALEDALLTNDERPAHEAALFVAGATPPILDLLRARQVSGLVSFVTSTSALPELAHWRQGDLQRGIVTGNG